VLFDGAFAGRAWAVREGMPELPQRTSSRSEMPPASVAGPLSQRRKSGKGTIELQEAPPKAEPLPPQPRVDVDAVRGQGALTLLAMLQQDGRLVDFLQQDVTTFSDEEVAAAARVVHDGCKKALSSHVTIEAVRSEAEGDRVVLAEGYETELVKLTGNVRGKAPYEGVLRHKGWRATKVSLPTPTKGHDATVVCPAEVEL
jgi:hypothetical protein